MVISCTTHSTISWYRLHASKINLYLKHACCFYVSMGMELITKINFRFFISNWNNLTTKMFIKPSIQTSAKADWEKICNLYINCKFLAHYFIDPSTVEASVECRLDPAGESIGISIYICNFFTSRLPQMLLVIFWWHTNIFINFFVLMCPLILHIRHMGTESQRNPFKWADCGIYT